MFSREARLPVDLCFDTSKDGTDERKHFQYVECLKHDLQRAYQLARQAADKTHLRNKRAYDQKVKFQKIQEGDRVLLKNLGLKGKHKLESRWSSIPHVVVGQMPNLPVFRVKPEEGRGRERTIHRDHILPIGQSVRIPVEQGCEETNVRPRTRSSRTRQRQKNVNQREEIPEVTDSSSEVEYEYSCRPYMEYVERILKRRETRDGISVRSQYEEDREPDTVQSAEELDSDEGNDEESQEEERDSGSDDPEIDLDTGRMLLKHLERV